MDEYDEPSDVEMMPIEEIERSRATLNPEPPPVTEMNDLN